MQWQFKYTRISLKFHEISKFHMFISTHTSYLLLHYISLQNTMIAPQIECNSFPSFSVDIVDKYHFHLPIFCIQLPSLPEERFAGFSKAFRVDVPLLKTLAIWSKERKMLSFSIPLRLLVPPSTNIYFCFAESGRRASTGNWCTREHLLCSLTLSMLCRPADFLLPFHTPSSAFRRAYYLHGLRASSIPRVSFQFKFHISSHFPSI